MKLWTRKQNAVNLHYDVSYEVNSLEEWRKIIYDPGIISSILWFDGQKFPISGPNYNNRTSRHEKDYRNSEAVNSDYKSACRRIAERLKDKIEGRKCLVYAPMRGAYPIWKIISGYLDCKNIEVYYSVTSSFVFYPKEFKIKNKKGKTASGRMTNVFELNRIKPFLKQYDLFLYVDEIVSGGMMRGHLKEMLDLKVHEEIPIIVLGLADAYGKRFNLKGRIVSRIGNEIKDFIWEGCESLITEDQRFLLGWHYTDYQLGPHVVPMINTKLSHFEEHRQFYNILASNCNK
jgi:hypothetical protein